MSATSQPMHVSVLGAGSWGSALAALAARHCDTLIWARDERVADAIKTSHHNPRYLPDIVLPAALGATHDLDQALNHVQHTSAASGLIILGIPMAGLDDICRHLAQKIFLSPACAALSVVWTCKGLHKDTSQLAHQIVQHHLSQHTDFGLGLGVLSG